MVDLPKKSGAGFTLIELLIVMGISIVLVAAAAPLYGNLQVSAQLNESTTLAVQSLRTARERSASGLGNVAHGVYFDINAGGADSYILYQGDSYATRNIEYDRTIELDEAISLGESDFNLTGTDVDINFPTSTTRASNAGTLIFTHEAAGNRNISVEFSGKIEEN